MGIAEESLAFHYEKMGKIEIVSTVSVDNEKDLSLAYTPGVAKPCIYARRRKAMSGDSEGCRKVL